MSNPTRSNPTMSNDIVFFHSGGFNPDGLQGPFFPIGVIGLASFLEKNGFSARIVNLMLEKILDPGLDFADTIKAYAPPVIGIDLHWFVHSYETVELARLCKEVSPDSIIVLGGLTASQYDGEILENFPFIDAVIRGDAEIPLLQVVSYVTGCEGNRGSLPDIPQIRDIPNLSFRTPEGEVARNPHGFKIPRAMMDEIDYMRFDLLENWEKTFSLFNADYIPAAESGRTSDLNAYYNPALPVKSWILYTGRGCFHKCTFCGGSATAFKSAFGRILLLRSPGKVADDVMAYRHTPANILYIPHSPLITPSEYHHRLLDAVENRLKAEGQTRLDMGFIFEDCPFRVDLDILNRYLRVFDRRKSIFRIYLADSDKETVDFNHFPVDLDQTELLIDFLIGRAHVLIGILIGLPGQTRKSTEKLAEFAAKAKKKGAHVMVYNAELHPGSELIRFPDTYGVELELKSFMDYYRHLEQKKDKSMIYGYTTSNEISIAEQRLIFEKALGPTDLNLRN